MTRHLTLLPPLWNLDPPPHYDQGEAHLSEWSIFGQTVGSGQNLTGFHEVWNYTGTKLELELESGIREKHSTLVKGRALVLCSLRRFSASPSPNEI